ncbi:hypothetical protein [Microcystis aeruginosa]|uniref:hypothetical protein n=1 Tax=Microcystis aeruginosa TaxID=1126 RepID=UPI0005C752DB|nr:hypothetical protein [Microcystis aeruginosa]
MWDQIVTTAEPHSKLDMVGFPCVNRSDLGVSSVERKSSRPKFNLQATLGYLFPQKRIAPLHLINAPYKIGVLLRSAFGIALNQPNDGVPVQRLVIRLFLCNVI